MAPGLLAVWGALLLSPAAALAAGDSQVTAVSSQVSDDYVRVRLADGSYQPETYTFGNGGRMAGPSRDDTIDKLSFDDVATAISGPLERQKYLPVDDRNPEKTTLLILVYWGTTTGTEGTSGSAEFQNLQNSQPAGNSKASPPPPAGNPSGPKSGGASSVILGKSQPGTMASEMATVAAAEYQRDIDDMRNAQLLGYDSALSQAGGSGISTFKLRRDDLVSEIEQSRYFVVLMAYDFQSMWKQKKHRLLWVTRFSVRERGNDFGRILPSMVGYAAQYFGLDTHGLVRKPLPEGNIKIGEPKSLGEVPER
jgi:hypothetical protein